MVNEMSLRLEKLVEDIKEETILWPIEDAKNSPEEDSAWARIGAKHKMTGPHVKSIFKVLSKKYEVEKTNPNTEWKLFSYLSFLNQKKDESVENDQDFEGDDGEEFVELLEVNDEYCSDDEELNTSGGSASEHSSKNISTEKQQIAQIPAEIQVRKIRNDKSNQDKLNPGKHDTKNGAIRKIRENLSSENGVKITPTSIKTAEQIVKKSTSPISRKVIRIPIGLSKHSNVSVQEKKLQSTLTSSLKLALKKDEKQKQSVTNLKEIKLKRKVENSKNVEKEDEDINSPPIKRQLVIPKGIKVIPTSSKSSVSKTIVSPQLEIHQQPGALHEATSANFIPISPTDKLPPFSSILKKSPTSLSKDQEHKISPTKAQHQKQENEQQNRNNAEMSLTSQKLNIVSNVANNNKMNGVDTIRKDFSDKSEAKLEIEQISKDADENTEIKVKVLTEQAEKILPTFFRDLYNSTKYDSFGMYVSSTMNRLPSHLASKLEAKILQSIIEINAMVDERMEDI